MKRTTVFVKSVGSVRCLLSGKQTVLIPIFPGILKHPTVGQLRKLLSDPAVASKYTVEALKIAPWPVLRKFPAKWLKRCLSEAHLGRRRRQAILFLLT